MYDIIIIGGGPAGLTAAVYGLRAGKKVLVIEKGTFGGQITSSPKVENIPGFVSVTGNEFAEKLIEQAMNLGLDVECCEALGIIDEDIKTVKTDEGDFYAKSVIIATGTKHRLLGIEKEEEFIGNGISFCAVCDGAFYEDKTVAVIGGGNSALQEAVLLSETCKKVYIVQNLDFLTGEKKLAEQLEKKENVEIILGVTVSKIIADKDIKGIIIKKEATGEETTLDIDGMFIAVGLIPQNEIFKDTLKLNDWGYVEASEDCKTNRDGIFVAGDCRTKRIRQVATAASDGAIAALAACDYIK
ncbi:MAG: FAD-dependent oxidoreductase [Ruminococcaceae bacterium]|nr:FAD-dependent oxidoreductase [Oscillospiraceae bacterium]